MVALMVVVLVVIVVVVGELEIGGHSCIDEEGRRKKGRDSTLTVGRSRTHGGLPRQTKVDDCG